MNITQEQKELIESQGYMVIEFKMFLNKTIDLLKRSFDSFIKAFISFIDSKAVSKYVESIKVWAKKTSEILKELIDTYDPRKELFAKAHLRVVPKFIRRIEKKYSYKYNRRPMYIRARNNC